MYLVLVQYVRPLAAIDHYLDQHLAFLQKYYETGQFILSGRRKPRTGGLILVKAGSRREVEAIMAEDPFDRLQLALYEIIEFEPTTMIEELQSHLG
ncbi:MAG TPA: YciI family protein [Chitinophaga sp.]